MPSIDSFSKRSLFPFVFAACLVLVGCNTTSNLVGSGDISLAQNVADNFRNEYLKKPDAGFYFVSEDGYYARYNHCLEGAGNCELGRFEFDALRSCERASEQSCYLFAIGHEVVWRGSVDFEGKRPPRTPRLSTGRMPVSASERPCGTARPQGGQRTPPYIGGKRSTEGTRRRNAWRY